MKILKKLFVLSIVVVSVGQWSFAKKDPYQKLALEISRSGDMFINKKIAIIPFSYADGRADSIDGAVISERITMKMINLQKFEIIERSVLDKIMNELELQASGIMDANSTKELGKVLGVDAIITGTLIQMPGGKIEVNARLIKTETAQAIVAVQAIVEKDWVGGDTPATQDDVQRDIYQPKSKPAVVEARVRGKNEYAFFDLLLGFGEPNIMLEFANSLGNIWLTSNANDSGNHLGINYSGGTGNFRSVKWDNLLSEGVGPISIRMGGFGKGALGGAIEFSLEKRNIKPQSTTWRLNNGSSANFTFTSDDYLTVISLGFSGDLLIRYAGEKIDPYIGMGIGISVNSISLPYVKGYTNPFTFSKPVEQYALGFIFRIPVGMRIKIAANTQIIAELRFELNAIGFDRDIDGESDRIVISGGKIFIGLGNKF